MVLVWEVSVARFVQATRFENHIASSERMRASRKHNKRDDSAVRVYGSLTHTHGSIR